MTLIVYRHAGGKARASSPGYRILYISSTRQNDSCPARKPRGFPCTAPFRQHVAHVSQSAVMSTCFTGVLVETEGWPCQSQGREHEFGLRRAYRGPVAPVGRPNRVDMHRSCKLRTRTSLHTNQAPSPKNNEDATSSNMLKRLLSIPMAIVVEQPPSNPRAQGRCSSRSDDGCVVRSSHL